MAELWAQHGPAAGGMDLNEWLRAQVDLTILSDSRLGFEATVGEKEAGNIAKLCVRLQFISFTEVLTCFTKV